MLVIVAEQARSDRDEIVAHLEAPSEAANKFLLGLEEAVLHLSLFPYTAVTRRDLTRLDVRFWLISPYFLVSEVKSDTLTVLAIVHTARNIRKELRERLGKKPTR